MHLKRTATFVVVGAALVAWLAAAATSGRRVAPEPPARSTGAEPDAIELATQVARLHDRLVPGPIPAQPGRDLFRFAAPKARPAPPAALHPAAISEASAEPAAPVRPVLKLAGIAEDGDPGAVVRTAIIATGGQLYLAKEGESVTPRFKISRIAADVVELVDLADNTTLRLPLR